MENITTPACMTTTLKPCQIFMTNAEKRILKTMRNSSSMKKKYSSKKKTKKDPTGSLKNANPKPSSNSSITAYKTSGLPSTFCMKFLIKFTIKNNFVSCQLLTVTIGFIKPQYTLHLDMPMINYLIIEYHRIIYRYVGLL